MKNKKIPMRRCVGCMESKPKSELIRLVAFENQINIDLQGKANGRGVYLCREKACFEKARKRKAITRGLDIDISEEKLNQIFEELLKYEGKDK